MSEVLHLRPSDARRVPWKNGRGFTDELAIWPPGAIFERGDFDWRISKAAVEEAGPFSSFPGFDRVLVVTEGAGLELDHGPAASRGRVEKLVPYRFSGDWPTRAELVDGRVADFNVLCRRGRARADVEMWSGNVERKLELDSADQLFVHVLSGELETRGACARSGESLWVRETASVRLRSTGRAILTSIR